MTCLNRRSLWITVFFLFASVLLLFSGCQKNPSQMSISDVGFYFDTVVEIKLNGTEDETILKECFNLMAEYESLLSRTRKDSDVWKINHSDGAPVAVSEDTAALIRLARTYYDLSDGAFDITIAPYVTLWDFQNNSGTIPSQDELTAASKHVGFENVQVSGNTVTLADSETQIDLGGIAKGFIADRLKEYLTGKGIESAWINLGGNVLTIGTKPDKSLWKIGIRKPFGAADETAAVISVSGKSVVTSGTYERYFEKDGTIYHHILQPMTGQPVQNHLYSVTILSDSSADGDALSTTCFVLGKEDGIELVESLDGIEALFITDEQELIYSSGFPHQ